MRALMCTGAALCAAFVWSIGPQDAEARQRGQLLANMVSRGIERPASGREVSYGPGTLTVEQLADCLMTAKILDDRSEELEELRDKLAIRLAEVDASSAELERKKASVDRTSQGALESFKAAASDHDAMVRQVERIQTYVEGRAVRHRADLDHHKVECGKPYYADDLEGARRRAGLWRPGPRVQP